MLAKEGYRAIQVHRDKLHTTQIELPGFEGKQELAALKDGFERFWQAACDHVVGILNLPLEESVDL